MLGYRVMDIIAKPEIENFPDDGSKDAFEHAPLYRGHALLFQINDQHIGSARRVGCDAGARDGHLGASVWERDTPWGTRIGFAISGRGCAVDDRGEGSELPRCRSGDVVGGVLDSSDPGLSPGA